MTENLLQTIEKHLGPADIKQVRCIDERQMLDDTNGVEIPGAVFGIVDAVKALKGYSEDQAWQAVVDAGIPIMAHIDDHHGSHGCGYARLVEESPEKVLAVESVSAAERLKRVKQLGGNVWTYVGEHAPKMAVINYRHGTSIDPDSAPQLGIFSFDAWAAGVFAQRLGIDPQTMVDHMTQMHKNTVTTLTNGALRSFSEIR